ncbi:hypothetical protein QTP88_023730 [Uroleucon formosanum]
MPVGPILTTDLLIQSRYWFQRGFSVSGEPGRDSTQCTSDINVIAPRVMKTRTELFLVTARDRPFYPNLTGPHPSRNSKPDQPNLAGCGFARYTITAVSHCRRLAGRYGHSLLFGEPSYIINITIVDVSSNSSLRSVALMFMMFGPFLKEFNELHNFSKSNSGKNEICSKYFGSKYEKSAPALLAFARRPNNVLASCDGVDGRPLCDRTTSCAHNITLRGNDWRGPVTSYVLYELGV